jgi:hypothetical protein
VKYGIDPVYALAFFMQESTFGTQGVATVTHSLGNIRANSGDPQYHGYRMYSTWEAGFVDWYKLMAHQYIAQWQLTTVDQIVPIYAPGSDNNDVTTYISNIKNAVDVWHSGAVEYKGNNNIPNVVGIPTTFGILLFPKLTTPYSLIVAILRPGLL